MKTDARYAILAASAEDMFGRHPDTLSPPADPRLAAAGYTVLAYVTAVDQLFSFGRERVNYGYLGVGNDECVLVFRGTERAIEWAKDAEGAKVSHPITGEVHSGFWNIYDSARLLSSGVEKNLIASVMEIVNKDRLIVIGHSLGAPLATYAAYDSSVMHPEQIVARLFASPRPGDATFTAAASLAIRDHQSYAYEPDVVPKVPFGFGYTPLTNLTVIPKNTRVSDTPGSNHHAINYAWLIDPDSVPTGPI